ncbi:hypothetical protein AT261_05465 [Bacillus cereus]|uniref:hypothetical protein n=1 Tax=Bacillus sp. FSL K6-0040 TaxID=2921406 RepID=UPI00077AE22A|nr:hypothetical protein AT261_05465 [Bacillus cereus]
MNTLNLLWNNYTFTRKTRLLISYISLFISVFILIQFSMIPFTNSYEKINVVEIMSITFSLPFFSTVIFVLFILSCSDMYISEIQILKIIRLTNRQQLKNILISNILFASFIFIVILFIFSFGISVSFIGLSKSFFSISTLKWLIINFIFLFLCLFILGILIIIIGLITKKLFIAVTIPIILSFIDSFFSISFIFKQATINVDQIADPLSLIYNSLYLLLLSYALIIALEKIIKKYNFY